MNTEMFYIKEGKLKSFISDVEISKLDTPI